MELNKRQQDMLWWLSFFIIGWIVGTLLPWYLVFLFVLIFVLLTVAFSQEGSGRYG